MKEQQEKLDKMMIKVDKVTKEDATKEDDEQGGATMKDTAVMMIFVAALFIGSCIGCMCLYAIMKCN